MVLCAFAPVGTTCKANATSSPPIAMTRIVVTPFLWELTPPVTPSIQLLALVGYAAAPLEMRGEEHQWPGQNEIDQCNRGQHFDRPEILRRQQPSAIHHFGQRDDSRERRL